MEGYGDRLTLRSGYGTLAYIFGSECWPWVQSTVMLDSLVLTYPTGTGSAIWGLWEGLIARPIFLVLGCVFEEVAVIYPIRTVDATVSRNGEHWNTMWQYAWQGILSDSGGFFLACEDFGRMFDNSFPACSPPPFFLSQKVTLECNVRTYQTVSN